METIPQKVSSLTEKFFPREEKIQEEFEKYSMEIDWKTYSVYWIIKELEEFIKVKYLFRKKPLEILSEVLDFADRKSIISDNLSAIEIYARWEIGLDEDDDEYYDSMIRLAGWIILYNLVK